MLIAAYMAAARHLFYRKQAAALSTVNTVLILYPHMGQGSSLASADLVIQLITQNLF